MFLTNSTMFFALRGMLVWELKLALLKIKELIYVAQAHTYPQLARRSNGR